MYHCVYEAHESESGLQFVGSMPYKVNSLLFEDHVRTVANYLDAYSLPKTSVEFTFDDGGVSFYSVIAPILEKYGFKGIFCISTSFIGTDKFLTQEHIRDLFQRGHVIASHTHTHSKDLARIEWKDVLREWEISCDILGNIIGEDVVVASIPHGNINKKVIDAACGSGIKQLYTSEPTTTVKDYEGMKIIGRYVVHKDTTTQEIMKVIKSPSYRFRKMIRRRVLGLLKVCLGENYRVAKNFILKKSR